jgi:L-arabinose transport system substrate-binding protein
MEETMNRPLTLLSVAAAAALVAGSAAADDVKIGYINKMGDHPWFVAEVAGAKAAAEAAGVGFASQDVQFNADLTITTFDTMVGDGVKGIAIVVPDKGLGPVIADKAKAAGVKLVAVDDDIYFADGTQVPYVGMNAHNIGLRVGEKLAELYKAEGWADKEVRIASIEDRKADTCMQRNQGAEEAFLKAVPDFNPANIVRVPYDNTMVNSIDVMTTTLTANPNVTNWIFYSCNDDGVLGAARALENSGYSADQGMGIGIDGSRACDAFGSGRPTAFRGTMWLNSENHGATAVKLLLASIKDGTDLPTQTFTDPEFINAENFASTYKAKLCK